MFKRSYNRALIRLRLETRSPLLIRSGDTGLDPTGTDLSCVRTRHGRFGRSVYIPGSSLKGVLRSAAEAAIRGETFDGIPGACDPFADDACGRREGTSAQDGTATDAVHRAHCLACRLFGSTAMKGRCAVRDLFPWPEDVETLTAAQQDNVTAANRTELRHGVAIDRITGSVRHGGLFDSEMVPAGVSFYGDIALENYQAWQLGLLAAAIQELRDGFAQLGSSKSRGLGTVGVEVRELVHEQPLRRGERPCAVGDLAPAPEVEGYGLLAERPLPTAEGTTRGLSRRFQLVGDAGRRWLDEGQAALEGLA